MILTGLEKANHVDGAAQSNSCWQSPTEAIFLTGFKLESRLRPEAPLWPFSQFQCPNFIWPSHSSRFANAFERGGADSEFTERMTLCPFLSMSIHLLILALAQAPVSVPVSIAAGVPLKRWRRALRPVYFAVIVLTEEPERHCPTPR